MQQIARGIFIETSYLGVTVGGLVYSHGIILVDAPLRVEDTRSWRSTLLNQRGGTNRLLINLDAHPDRTLGARAVDYTIVAHQKTAAVFRNRPTIFKGQSEETGSTWESYSDAIGMRWAPPDITFSDRMSLHWGWPEVVLEYHPGPTAGSIWVIIPAEKVVFVGDTVVMDQPPFLASADPTAWLESLDLLLDQYASYNIVSGRGGLASAGVIRQTQHFINETNRCVERLARRNIAPETTEELIPTLLPLIPFPPERQERYTQRIRYGLHQYFIRRYRPATSSEQSTPEDEEQ